MCNTGLMRYTDAQQGLAREILEHGVAYRTGQALAGVEELAELGVVEYLQHEHPFGNSQFGVRLIIWETGKPPPPLGYLVDSHNRVVEAMLYKPPRYAIPYGLHWVAAHPDASDPQ